MELNTFDGGVSVRLDPQYIAPNEGTVVNNVDVDVGTLKSIGKDKLTGFGNRGKRPFWWNGVLFSNDQDAIFVEFDRRIWKNYAGFLYVSDYWDDITEPIQWSPVGLDAPFGALDVSEMEWDLAVEEIEDASGELRSPLNENYFVIVVDDVGYNHHHRYLSHGNNPFFLEFSMPNDGRLYKLYRDKGQGNYTEVGTSNDGSPIRYGTELSSGTSLFGQYTYEVFDTFEGDSTFDVTMNITSVVTDGEYITFKIDYLGGLSKTIRLESDLEAKEWFIISSHIFGNTMVVVCEEKLFTFDGIAFKANDWELVSGYTVHDCGDWYIIISEELMQSIPKDLTVDTIGTAQLDGRKNLGYYAFSGEEVEDYWYYNNILYGLVGNRLYSSHVTFGEQSALTDWSYVEYFEGEYWGNNSSDNLVEDGVMYLPFKGSIVMFNINSGTTTNYGVPYLEVEEPYRNIADGQSYSIKDKVMQCVSTVRTQSALTKTYVYKIIVDDTATSSSIMDGVPLDKSNMLYGNYTYTMAYVNDTGSQSDLMASSQSIDVDMGAVKVEIPQSVIDGIPTDGELILFRTMGMGGQYYEVIRWDATTAVTEYIDNTHDIDLGLPPTNWGGNPPPDGLQYLIEHRGRLYGTVGNRVYFSEYGDPHNWPTINYLVVPETVTGLASSGNGIIVFAGGRIDVILGLDIDNYQLRPVSGSVGCEYYKTIQSTSKGVIFMGEGAIYSTDGTSVINLSEDKVGRSLKALRDIDFRDITSSVYSNDLYMIATEDTMIVMDLIRGIKFYSITDNSFDGQGYTSINENNGNIYGHKGGVTYSLNKSNLPALLEFKSGDIISGTVTNLKEYDKTRIVYQGSFEVWVYLDDELVINKKITSSSKELTMLGFSNSKNRGTRLSYTVIGVGTIYGIDFIVKGRSNQP